MKLGGRYKRMLMSKLNQLLVRLEQENDANARDLRAAIELLERLFEERKLLKHQRAHLAYELDQLKLKRHLTT